MRIRYDPNEERFAIILKEESVLLYDEEHGDLGFRVFYSEKGEIAEIRFRNIIKYIDLSQGIFELIQPDYLPYRRYVFQYGGDGRYWGCTDSYTHIRDTDDRINWKTVLSVKHRDQTPMPYYEINKIREEFFDDMVEWNQDSMYDGCFASVYVDDILYFWWQRDDLPGLYSETGFKEFIVKSLEEMGYIEYDIKERDFGFDVICADCGLALICLCDDEYLQDEGSSEADQPIIYKKDLVKIFREIPDLDDLKIVLNEISLNKSAQDYANAHKVQAMKPDDVLKEVFLVTADRYDDCAADDPEDWRRHMSELFRSADQYYYGTWF
ncbi:hypothetical protein [Methanoculleus bourgensis]|jgi:hypothetical protein|uniref:hypothetical protein n=1 Tax=Methanoculleus bourgensis TaxID=83986 RepID=UPI0022EFC9A0|nr:hypothetical protein [Methanoculleus bourgensis]GLI47611.1 hypothetical protein MBOURGENBZM_24030 [Methanoculleus bourgensis]